MRIKTVILMSFLVTVLSFSMVVASNAPSQSMTTATPAPTEEMGGMDMSMMGDYNTNDYAPLAMGLYNGETLYFVHTEASDETVAQVLTAMMGPDVLTVPSLADIPEDLLGKVYVFTNGVAAMGPLGFQSDVFDSVPGDENYTPLRSIYLVTWQEGAEPVELTSVADILAAAEAGDVVIEQPGIVVNMPILVWGESTR